VIPWVLKPTIIRGDTMTDGQTQTDTQQIDTEEYTYKQQGDLISLLLFFKNKKLDKMQLSCIVLRLTGPFPKSSGIKYLEEFTIDINE
jgi:hypothetical protein